MTDKSVPTFSTAAAAWFEDHKRYLKPNTADSYADALGPLNRFFGDKPWLVSPLLTGWRSWARNRSWTGFWLMLLASYLIFAVALPGGRFIGMTKLTQVSETEALADDSLGEALETSRALGA